MARWGFESWMSFPWATGPYPSALRKELRPPTPLQESAPQPEAAPHRAVSMEGRKRKPRVNESSSLSLGDR